MLTKQTLLDVEEAYQTLGVPFNSPPDKVRKAYRRLAKSAHPDRQGSDSRMISINAAHDLVEDYLVHPQVYMDITQAIVNFNDARNKNDPDEIMRVVKNNQLMLAVLKSESTFKKRFYKSKIPA